MAKYPVLCVVGPTASGKTALSVRLAKALDGEVVSMDSMQIYRGMDIGTAKPSMADRQEIPHHLVDIVEPSECFTVAQYAKLAQQTIQDILDRGKVPLLVGGTGFYLRALTDGLTLGGIPSDPEVREALKAQAQTESGKQALHDRLRQVDPASAAKLHPHDIQRVSRALEVYQRTGQPISEQPKPPPEGSLDFCLLGTTMDRQRLYERINRRVDEMMAAGLLTEVENLLAAGVSPQAQSMQGIGYRELAPVADGARALPEAIVALKQNTRHYAKRQWTWFRAVERITWLDMASRESADEALRIAEAFWKGAKP